MTPWLPRWTSTRTGLGSPSSARVRRVHVGGVGPALAWLDRRIGVPAPEPGEPGDPGLFGPGSTVWRIGRERALLLGGPAALLMQIAHPLVATAVAAHSDFGADPF